MRHALIGRMLATLVAGALVAGAVPMSAHAADKPLRKVTFVFPTPVMDLRYVPASVGMELGFFRDEGIEPTFQNLPGSSAAIQAVMAGQADLGTSTNEPAITSRQKNIPVRYFYEWYTKVIYRVGVLDTSPIRSVADLRGKKLGIQSFASAALPYTKAMLRAAGLNPDSDVTFLPVGVGAQAAAALRGGQVDALALWDTQYAGIENLGVKFRYFAHPDLANLSSGGLFSSDEWLKANGDVAVRFGRAWAKASTFIYANPDAAIRIHWKAFPQTKPKGVADDEAFKQAQHVLRTVLEYHSREHKKSQAWGAFTPDEWQRYIDFLVQEKVIPASFPASQIITNDYIKAINDFPADKIRALAQGYQVR